MTTINTSSLAHYAPAFSAGVKASDDATKSESATATVDLKGAAATEKLQGSLTTKDQMIKQLQDQIKQTQKMLQQQQQQLAVAQNSKASEQEKATQVMAIQQQISGTNAQLAAQQAALLELMKGTVSTTA
jgi:septal ring factor EnvC (AmiA/AmiB activator)